MSRGVKTIFLRLLIAVAGGAISSLAMPRENISPLIFVSVFLLLASVRGLRAWSAFAVGFAGGLAFYISQIEWMSLYLGPVPLLALSVMESFIFGAGMFAISRVWQNLEQAISFKNSARVSVVALAIAIVWSLREWISTHLPYGGFPWSTLAQSQSDAFLAKWAYLGGAAWLSFVVSIIAALATVWFFDSTRSLRKIDVWAASLMAVLVLVPLAIAIPTSPEDGTMRIAAVQGNANAGLFANPIRGSILKNHLDASSKLKYFYPKPDVVVWPENASDLNPFTNAQANLAITNFVNTDVKAPLIFGTITERGSDIYNSSILWRPQIGATDWYDKKRPVPFAEYVPDRDFWYSLAPDLVGLISRGYSFGTRDGIFQVSKVNDDGQYQTVSLGVLICFEIAIDEISKDLVNQGAQLILSQTNNADFGQSDETYQQTAFAKLRAIETGRAVVNISTVGVSAIYLPDGRTLKQLPAFEPGFMLERVPLRSSITPAMAIGEGLTLTINVIGIFLVATNVMPAAPRRRLRAGAKKLRAKIYRSA